MGAQFSEAGGQVSQRRVGDASKYSARVQEAMRYNKLSSSAYALVMTLLDAVLQGYTEERWETEQQRIMKTLINQSPDKSISHVDAANRYEQVVGCLKDLMLWPW